MDWNGLAPLIPVMVIVAAVGGFIVGWFAKEVWSEDPPSDHDRPAL